MSTIYEKPSTRGKKSQSLLGPKHIALLTVLHALDRPAHIHELMQNPTVQAQGMSQTQASYYLKAMQARKVIAARGRSTAAVWFIPDGVKLPKLLQHIPAAPRPAAPQAADSPGADVDQAKALLLRAAASLERAQRFEDARNLQHRVLLLEDWQQKRMPKP